MVLISNFLAETWKFLLVRILDGRVLAGLKADWANMLCSSKCCNRWYQLCKWVWSGFFIFLPFFWVFLFSILMGKRIGRAIFADNCVVKPLRFYWLEANFAFFYELILYVRNLITSEKKNKTWKTKTKKPRAKKKLFICVQISLTFSSSIYNITNNYNTKWLLLQSQVL